jgi:hypothetical protein
MLLEVQCDEGWTFGAFISVPCAENRGTPKEGSINPQYGEHMKKQPKDRVQKLRDLQLGSNKKQGN